MIDAKTPTTLAIACVEIERLQAEIARLHVEYQATDTSHPARLESREWGRALDHIADPIFVHDPEFRIVHANRAYAAHAGLAVQDLIGKPYWQIFPKLGAPLHSCGQATEQRRETEEELRLPNGEVFVSRTHPIYDASGQYRYSLHILQNSTQRRSAEDALRELKERYQTIFTSARDGIALIDANTGLVVDCNPEFERQNGRTLAQLRGTHVCDLRPPALREAARRKFEEIRAEGRGESSELDFEQPDGSVLPVDLLARLVSIGQRQYILSLTRDITERRKAEAALKESEQRLRFFIENTPAAVAMLDTEMRYIAYSRRWISDYGLPDRDITGRSHYELFPEIPERWKEIHQRCLAGETARSDAEPFARADGHTDWVKWEILPWRRRDGKIGGIIIFSEVITARKEAEEALRASESRFRATFEQAAVGIAHVAPDGRWLLINHKLCDIVGYTHEEMLAKTFQDITHPDDLQADLAYVKQMLAGEIQTYSMEKRYIRKNGAIVWINLTVALVRRADGTPDYFISVIEDINEKKQAAQKLREQMEELLRWQAVMLDREGRVQQLKREVNQLLAQQGKLARYPSQTQP